MQAQLSETMNFMRQVERQYSYQGAVLLSRLERLSNVLLDQQGDAKVVLEFGTSVDYASLTGRISASLQIECQRCLGPMRIEADSSFKFAFVHDNAAGDLLPDAFEPYLIVGEEQSVIALLEDELLLSLPMVASHQEDCSELMRDQGAQVRAQRQALHPFAALKALKRDV